MSAHQDSNCPFIAYPLVQGRCGFCGWEESEPAPAPSPASLDLELLADWLDEMAMNLNCGLLSDKAAYLRRLRVERESPKAPRPLKLVAQLGTEGELFLSVGGPTQWYGPYPHLVGKEAAYRINSFEPQPTPNTNGEQK